MPHGEALYISCEVGTDLSAAQYHMVKIGAADNVIIIASAQGEPILGVLQEPVDGSVNTGVGLVCVSGKTKLRYGVTLARADLGSTESDGEGGIAAAADTVLFYTLESGVDQDIKHVVFQGGNGTFS